MNKHNIVINRENILNIKTGIDCYRGITFIFSCITGLFFICSLIYERKEMEIVISLILMIIFIIITVFMEKLVYILHLPTRHLIVTKDKIIFRKGRKQREYIIKDTMIKFHSFFESFQPSTVHIKTYDKEDYILLTKNQFKQLNYFITEV